MSKGEGQGGLHRRLCLQNERKFFKVLILYCFSSLQGTMEYLTFAAVSKLIAASITYPYQVVRSRLQDVNCPYGSSRDCVRQILRYEGVRGLYNGMRPYLLHVVPNVCIVLLIYEQFTNNSWHLLHKRKLSILAVNWKTILPWSKVANSVRKIDPSSVNQPCFRMSKNRSSCHEYYFQIGPFQTAFSLCLYINYFIKTYQTFITILSSVLYRLY